MYIMYFKNNVIGSMVQDAPGQGYSIALTCLGQLSCGLGHHTNQNFPRMPVMMQSSTYAAIRVYVFPIPSVGKHQTVGSVRVPRSPTDVRNQSTESHQLRGALPCPCTAFASLATDPKLCSWHTRFRQMLLHARRRCFVLAHSLFGEILASCKNLFRCFSACAGNGDAAHLR